jgi:DNA-directed RNA polymerase
MKIGAFLASTFIQTARIPLKPGHPEQLFMEALAYENKDQVEFTLAFKHGYQAMAAKQVGVFIPAPALTKRLDWHTARGDRPMQGVSLPKLLPMVVPPKPWIDYRSGGYLTIQTYCMRGLTKEMEWLMKQGSLNGKLGQVFSGLDALGQTRWRINDRVLQHMIHAWNTGNKVAKLPVDIPERLEVPPKPDNYETDLKSRIAYNREVRELKRQYGDMKSQRATENYKLEIARAFVGRTLYFPHNLDFRGRAYPIPPLFNHIGNDLARALLIFDRQKPLGSNGLRWLKIHLANAFGNDKCTFDERAAFVDENMDNVMASADDPFGQNPEKNGWWLKADKPWLTLATSIELAAAIRSGNPEAFKSRMPVHQDGSCNGLQHYAALGGDRAGAIQVNLAKGLDRPQDVNSAAAKIVADLLRNDIAKGEQLGLTFDRVNSAKAMEMMRAGQFESDECRFLMARLMTPERIDRKIVKQTVMTSVYGVTFVGAREQIYSRLKEKYLPGTFSKDEIYLLSRYLTPKVFDALDNMFQGARKIQDWLADTARIISNSVNEEDLLKSQGEDTMKKASQVIASQRRACVTWTTPLGLTVMQPYRKSKAYSVSTALQTFSIRAQSSHTPVDTQRQVAGFPPNFVHSLDATHMLMTASACAQLDDPIDFAAVHDSYWTHPSDVERLRTMLKEQFVALHSQPIMENLRQEFKQRYGGRKVLNVMAVDEFDERLQSMNDSNSGRVDYDSKLKQFVAVKPEEDEEVEMISSLTDSNDHSSLELEPTSAQPATSQVKQTQAKPKQRSRNAKSVQVWEHVEIPPLPERGDFDVKDVLESEYFFS